MKLCRNLPLLMTSCALASPAFAQPTMDARATDAMQVFNAFCVREGNREHALSVLGTGNAIATRLSDELTATLQGGQPGGVAWAIAGPNGSQIMLGYTRGRCEVRIADADEQTVRNSFAKLASDRAAETGAKLSASSPEPRQQNGARRTYQTYSYPVSGLTAILAITTSDKRNGSEQHLMTFGFIK